MSDDTPRDTPAQQAGDQTQPVRAERVDPVEPAAQRRGFGERLRSVGRSGGSRTFGLAALIASTLAGIVVGGLGATAVGAIADDHERDHDRGPGRGGWVQRDDDRGGVPG